MTTIENVPQLRFPEFSGEWEEDLLENLATVERGKFSARPRNDPKYFGGSTPFIQTGDIVSSDLFINKYTQTLNDEGCQSASKFDQVSALKFDHPRT